MTGDDDTRRNDAPLPQEPAARPPAEQLVEMVRQAIPFGLGSQGALIGAGGAILLAAAAMMLGLLPSPFAASGGAGAPKQAAGTSLFQPVAAAELDKAIGLLMLPDADKAKVRADVQRGKLRIALITVSDNDTEDGDWVSISAAGFRQDVRLFHKPYVVAVPYLPGMPVAVTGLKDGGGGDITVAVTVGTTKLPLKPLKEREVVELLPP